MLLKDGENVAVERGGSNVARPSLHFYFVRSSGCKTEQSDYGRSKSGGLQWHNWISYAFSGLGCKPEDTAFDFT
jgi:hypothetical protein